jgi:hypothetical protein
MYVDHFLDGVLKESPMPWSPLAAKSRVSWGGDALVIILLACYETLEFWIEYAYLLGMKMLCYLVWAIHVLLIGLEYALSEVVARYLLIAQHASIREREFQFFS